jgi:hypothetical protein
MSSKMVDADIRELAENFCATGKSIPKTGLSAILRDWMKSRTGTKAQRRFAIRQICDALVVMTGKQRQAVSNALTDFVKRGEVISYQMKKCGGRPPMRVARQYIYNLDWRKAKKGTQNQKIFKAMYVSQSFAVTDIQRLAGEEDRNWIDKIVRRLKKDGHLQKIGRRLCAHGTGVEAIYHIVNRDKFKLECMK